MNNHQQNSKTEIVSSVRELIKGQEQKLLDELRQMVRRQSVCLDMSRTERIDAAGLAALVSLYCEARKAGHEFSVINPSHRVARVLAIVGLERMIVRAMPQEMAAVILLQRAPLNLEMVA